MAAAFPHLRRFTSAIHRRAVTLRVVESAGIGAGVAAIAIVLLLLLRFTRDFAGISFCLTILLVGVALGAVWGIIRRPSRLQSAIRADGQLRLDDLLGTAVGLQRAAQPDATWTASLLQIADVACAGKSPREILLHRLGARAWGTIGLAVAMALTVSLLFSSEGTSSPQQRSTGATASLGEAGDHRSRALITIAPESPLGTHVAGSAEDQQGPGGQQNPDKVAAAPRKPEPNAPSPPQNNGGATAGNAAGDGSGFGKTNRPPPVAGSPTAADAHPAGVATTEDQRGKTLAAGGGVAQATNAAPTKPGQTGRVSAAAEGSTPTPPWRSDHWTADAQNAQQQLSAGQIAPQYRELVRKYFEMR